MRTRVVAAAVVVASVAAVGLAVRSGPAAAQTAAQSKAWTQSSVCPGNGLVLTLRAWNMHSRYHGTGADRWWSVTGKVTVTAPGRPSLTYAERYTGRDATPPDGGGTVVTGTSLQLTPGGGPVVVSGAASLSPDGFVGQVSGTTTSVCAAIGA